MKKVIYVLVSLLWLAGWFSYCQNLSGEYPLNHLAIMCLVAIMIWGSLMATIETFYPRKLVEVPRGATRIRS